VPQVHNRVARSRLDVHEAAPFELLPITDAPPGRLLIAASPGFSRKTKGRAKYHPASSANFERGSGGLDAMISFYEAFVLLIRAESKRFALSSSARRVALSPRPARLIKYVSIRNPELGPLGETFFEANVRAIVAASFVNSPFGGCVESVFTLATHRLFFATGICAPPEVCWTVLEFIVGFGADSNGRVGLMLA
jgi:hypothetical protein